MPKANLNVSKAMNTMRAIWGLILVARDVVDAAEETGESVKSIVGDIREKTKSIKEKAKDEAGNNGETQR